MAIKTMDCEKCGAEKIIPRFRFDKLWYHCGCGHVWTSLPLDAKNDPSPKRS